MVANRGSENFVSIQVLRGVAALMVAFSHCYGWIGAGGDLPGFPNFVGGTFGVDLFFVISGFVMVHAAGPLFGQADAPRRFFAQRLARIVPLYTASTLAAVALMTPAWPLRILASLTFWPEPPTGLPILEVGWTLNVEMMFYAAFSVALFSKNRAATVAITSAFLLLTIAIPSPLPWFTSLGNPLVMELIYGMGIASLYRAGIRLNAVAVALLIVVAVVAYAVLTPAIVLWSIQFPPGHHWLVPQQFSWGVPAAAIIAVATLVPWRLPRHGWLGSLAVLRFLGDISYALYLLHTMVFAILSGVLVRIGFSAADQAWWFVAIMLPAAIAISGLVHILFERPITRWLQGKPTARRPPQTSLDSRSYAAKR
jgi:peptidoglycan/LPS O-acetylase OafA/YrhL